MMDVPLASSRHVRCGGAREGVGQSVLEQATARRNRHHPAGSCIRLDGQVQITPPHYRTDHSPASASRDCQCWCLCRSVIKDSRFLFPMVLPASGCEVSNTAYPIVQTPAASTLPVPWLPHCSTSGTKEEGMVHSGQHGFRQLVCVDNPSDKTRITLIVNFGRADAGLWPGYRPKSETLVAVTPRQRQILTPGSPVWNEPALT